MFAKRTSKNRITLPKAVVTGFEGIEYFDVRAENGRIVLDPVLLDKAGQARARLRKIGIRKSDVDAAIRLVRG